MRCGREQVLPFSILDSPLLLLEDLGRMDGRPLVREKFEAALCVKWFNRFRFITVTGSDRCHVRTLSGCFALGFSSRNLSLRG